MKIYTKTGDNGDTSLFGGKRVPKYALRIEVYGTIDELNSVIGICRTINKIKKLENILKEIQNTLFKLGADLATPNSITNKRITRIQNTDIVKIEKLIDNIDSNLQTLKYFILPGGSRLAAYLHFARAICRRAERLLTKLMHKEKIRNQSLVYLNRLSDLFFVLARWVNKALKVPEEKWSAY